MDPFQKGFRRAVYLFKLQGLGFNMSRSSRGLGHRPFTAVTGVRLPYGTPNLLLRE